MVFSVILAGGVGNRMGHTDKPKQFLTIKDKPIIIHTVEKFLSQPEFEKIIISHYRCTYAIYISNNKELIFEEEENHERTSEAKHQHRQSHHLLARGNRLLRTIRTHYDPCVSHIDKGCKFIFLTLLQKEHIQVLCDLLLTLQCHEMNLLVGI